MSYTLSANIKIGTQINIDYVHEVNIKSSWNLLTSTASIKLPRNSRLVGDPDGIKKYIKQGDKVIISLGYDGNLNQEFEGFVSGLIPSVPLEISCEDFMYQFKRVRITKTFKQVTLQDLITYFVSEYHSNPTRPRINYITQQTDIIGAYVFQGATIAQALETLKSTTGFVSYFRGNTLYVGFAYQFEGTNKRVTYHFEKNVADNGLVYKLSDDLKIHVKAISNQKNGQQLTYETGDPDGEQRTLNYTNASLAFLKEKADDDMKKFKAEGYRGNLTGFGLPFVQHGDTAILQTDLFPEREGGYIVDGVDVKFGMEGFRRILQPGYKVL